MALTRLSAAQARVLCLHYYSNALDFNFDDHEEEYREENIKEWDPVDPADIEQWLQSISTLGRSYQSFICCVGESDREILVTSRVGVCVWVTLINTKTRCISAVHQWQVLV